jgi:RIO kinase 3
MEEEEALRIALEQSALEVQATDHTDVSAALNPSTATSTGDVDDLDDLALAIKLQAEEDAKAPTSSASAVVVEDTTNDLELAKALQAQLDAEYHNEIDQQDREVNRGHSKLTIATRRQYTSSDRSEYEYQREDVPSDEEPNFSEDDDEEGFYYDKGVKCVRDASGTIVTKHNAAVSGRRNRHKMEHSFPVGFASGDLHATKGHSDIKVSNKIYNHLKRFAVKEAKQSARLHEKKDHSTAVMAMDKNTRLLVFRLVNNGNLDSVYGTVSSGKESVIFSAVGRIDPESEETEAVPLALKVFKTTLTEFTQRQQFLHGDPRYEHRVGKQHARKLVKIWAEKEWANLTRMHRAGMNCPEPVFQRKHLLAMTMIGGDSPAPKLKDVRLSERRAAKCFTALQEQMYIMYNTCKLVHCDLSQYNILYHSGKPWIIDVGQSVEITHPRSREYLYRDCVNVCKFFSTLAVEAASVPADMFRHITGERITQHEMSDYTQKIAAPGKGRIKAHEKALDMDGTSNVVLKFATPLTREDAMLYLARDGVNVSSDSMEPSSSDVDSAMDDVTMEACHQTKEKAQDTIPTNEDDDGDGDGFGTRD